MGYTHYWYRKLDMPVTDEQWAGIVTDFNAMLNLVDEQGTPIQFEYNNPAPPEISNERIRFNGKGDDGHETMCLERNPVPTRISESRTVFDFCKTARKPYDALVTGLLIAAEANAPDAWAISSDGWLEEWEPGFELFTKATGKEAPVLEGLESQQKGVKK